MKVWLNGAIVEAGEAVVSIYDHGFLYGLGLFETFRTYNGAPYLLEAHLERLNGGCDELGIRIELSRQQLADRVTEVLAANGLEDGYVRLTVSAGEGALGLPSEDYERPTVALMVKYLPVVDERVRLQGRELRLLTTRRNTPESSVRFKSLHYMNNIIARRELVGLGAATAEGLMLSRDGFLAEGIVSNLFFVDKGVVCTPAIDTGILPGVTRRRVLELARTAGYATEEGRYPWERLAQAEEIWMTNSVQELIPVTTLTDDCGRRRRVGDGEAGPVTRRLLRLYAADATLATTRGANDR